MKFKINERIKRKHHDFAEVIVISINEDYTMIRDMNGQHFIPTNKMEDHFESVEPDGVTEKIYGHSNTDDPRRHNISGTMGRPSIMQQKAFEAEVNDDLNKNK